MNTEAAPHQIVSRLSYVNVKLDVPKIRALVGKIVFVAPMLAIVVTAKIMMN